jgi:hypothetical protein
VADEKLKRNMEEPKNVIRELARDIHMLRLREKVLPSEEAARLNMLEKEKAAIIMINEKFAKTDYHTIYNQRVEKDSAEKIESKLKMYGIRLDADEKITLLKMKSKGIPKLNWKKSVLSCWSRCML